MGEVLLSEYLAHVFSQISNARDMADRYSREIALVYARDEVLRHFSVPRFKLAKLEMTMPVLVAELRVSALSQFQMPPDDFRSLVMAKVTEVAEQVRELRRDVKPALNSPMDALSPLIDAFYQQLASLPDPAESERVVASNWPEIAGRGMALHEVPIELTRQKPAAAILARAQLQLTEAIRLRLGMSKATIEQLLINPETQAVKGGSNDASVFTIRAELVEEGVLVKRVRDEQTGVESTVVEFE